jgi:hypothetical protein
MPTHICRSGEGGVYILTVCFTFLDICEKSSEPRVNGPALRRGVWGEGRSLENPSFPSFFPSFAYYLTIPNEQKQVT